MRKWSLKIVFYSSSFFSIIFLIYNILKIITYPPLPTNKRKINKKLINEFFVSFKKKKEENERKNLIPNQLIHYAWMSVYKYIHGIKLCLLLFFYYYWWLWWYVYELHNINKYIWLEIFINAFEWAHIYIF